MVEYVEFEKFAVNVLFNTFSSFSTNSKQPKGRQNFTLAHELYHLLYESSEGIIFCSSTNSNEESEKKANNFTSNLLLPNYALYKYQERMNIEKYY